VVGRTGAGKSSLLTALFRLSDEIHGGILIDGIDTSTVPLPTLRSKLSVIPQEPTLFSGTIRYNLDPFGEYTDDEVWLALERVQLKAFVCQFEHAFNTLVSEAGSNFSVGQKQLLCLARAILRYLRSPFVVNSIPVPIDETNRLHTYFDIGRTESWC
jgi:ATP-binding cassette, subfamily C (CFTR/MRP), member 4